MLARPSDMLKAIRVNESDWSSVEIVDQVGSIPQHVVAKIYRNIHSCYCRMLCDTSEYLQQRKPGKLSGS